MATITETEHERATRLEREARQRDLDEARWRESDAVNDMIAEALEELHHPRGFGQD
jgi:hypothetical protein